MYSNNHPGQSTTFAKDRVYLLCIVYLFLLGRLPKVDLIILEGGKCPSVRPSVRTSVRPSTKSFFDFNEIWYIGRGR